MSIGMTSKATIFNLSLADGSPDPIAKPICV